MTDDTASPAEPVRQPRRIVWLAAFLLLAAALILAVLTLMARCIVTGAVTLDGKPLTTGLVSFHPIDSGPIPNGRLDENGTFWLQTGGSRGAARGSYRVTIAANDEGAAAEAPETSPIRPLITPARYADPRTTDLRAEVGWGINRFQFDLQSKLPISAESK